MKQVQFSRGNSNYRCHKDRQNRRRGSVTMIMAGGSIFMLGCAALAVDYGLLVADANRLQRACDAGALAGAAKLKVTGNDEYDKYQARQEAQRVAQLNGAPVQWNDISFSNNDTRIHVPAATVRSFFFARAIGKTDGAITRTAKASVAGGSNLLTGGGRLRVAPIGISW